MRRQVISLFFMLWETQTAMMEWIMARRSLGVRCARRHHTMHSRPQYRQLYSDMDSWIERHNVLQGGAKSCSWTETAVCKHQTSNPSTFFKTICKTRRAPHLKPNFPFTDRVPNSRNYLVQGIDRNILIQESDFFPPQGVFFFFKAKELVSELNFNLCIFLFVQAHNSMTCSLSSQSAMLLDFFSLTGVGGIHTWGVLGEAMCQSIGGWMGRYDIVCDHVMSNTWSGEIYVNV